MKVRNKVKAKMANTFKKIIKKHKKKKLQAERNRKAKEDTATLFAPIMERLDQIEAKITQSQRTTRAKKESDSE